MSSEKSLYQCDDRIFYQPDFAYDVVERLSHASFLDGRLSVVAHLSSGEEATLQITSPLEDSLRVRLWQGEAMLEEASAMLVSHPGGQLCFAEDESSILLHLNTCSVRIDKNPFEFKVFGRPKAALVLALETDKVGDRFITGPLGL